MKEPDDESKAIGLNYKKTKIILNQFVPLPHQRVELNREQIAFVDHYIHLGQ